MYYNISDAIENINVVTLESEMNVLNSLISAYNKYSFMMESYSENTQQSTTSSKRFILYRLIDKIKQFVQMIIGRIHKMSNYKILDDIAGHEMDQIEMSFNVKEMLKLTNEIILHADIDDITKYQNWFRTKNIRLINNYISSVPNVNIQLKKFIDSVSSSGNTKTRMTEVHKLYQTMLFNRRNIEKYLDASKRFLDELNGLLNSNSFDDTIIQKFVQALMGEMSNIYAFLKLYDNGMNESMSNKRVIKPSYNNNI